MKCVDLGLEIVLAISYMDHTCWLSEAHYKVFKCMDYYTGKSRICQTYTFWHILCLREPDVHAKYHYFFFTFVFNVISYDIYNVHFY